MNYNVISNQKIIYFETTNHIFLYNLFNFSIENIEYISRFRVINNLLNHKYVLIKSYSIKIKKLWSQLNCSTF
jgi:hypothetical protein